ncbi:hypothetical protein JY536_03010 [Serratia marcescens]|nr:hypothetical protein [Serratia marcescens]
MTKKFLITLLFITSTFASIPVITYWVNFGGELSNKNSDWAAFGSFIGGVYSSIFSFASVLVLSVTLYLTQKNNKEQAQLLRLEITTKEFNLLLDELFINLATKEYPRYGKEDDFFKYMANDIIDYITDDGAKDYFEAAEMLLKDKCNGFYENESRILMRLDTTLKMLPDYAQEHYLIILYSRISNDRRFWLKCYVKAFGLDVADSVLSKENFCQLPLNIEEVKMIQDPQSDTASEMPQQVGNPE